MIDVKKIDQAIAQKLRCGVSTVEKVRLGTLTAKSQRAIVIRRIQRELKRSHRIMTNALQEIGR